HVAQVEHVEVVCEEGERDHGVVEVDPDLLLHSRLVAHDLSGRHPAHGHLALAGAQILHGEAAHVGRDALDVLDPAVAEVLLAGSDHGERRVVDGLLAAHGGDRHHLLTSGGERGGGGPGGGGGDRGRGV